MTPRRPQRPLLRTQQLPTAAVVAAFFGAAGTTHAQILSTGPCDDPLLSALHLTVVSRETNIPLAGADIRVAWSDTAGAITERRAAADALGTALLCVPADTPIEVSASFRSASAPRRQLVLPAASFVGRRTEIDLPHVFVRGRILDAAADAPVHNALVRVENTDVSTLTAADGRFVLPRLPIGDYTLSVAQLDYAVTRAPLQLRSDDLDVAIRIAPQPVPLAPIAVSVFSRRLDQVGFYERASRGIGTFIGRQQIDAAHAQFASDLLRTVPGIRLITTAARRDAPRSFTTGRGTCRFRFLVNGTRMLADFEIDNLAPLFIEGIEVYAGAAQIPAAFRGHAADALGATCGIIAVWTRDRR